jgi:hypothetical protein
MIGSRSATVRTTAAASAQKTRHETLQERLREQAFCRLFLPHVGSRLGRETVGSVDRRLRYEAWVWR